MAQHGLPKILLQTGENTERNKELNIRGTHFHLQSFGQAFHTSVQVCFQSFNARIVGLDHFLELEYADFISSESFELDVVVGDHTKLHTKGCAMEWGGNANSTAFYERDMLESVRMQCHFGVYSQLRAQFLHNTPRRAALFSLSPSLSLSLSHSALSRLIIRMHTHHKKRKYSGTAHILAR
jgi:hypothetical protein